MCRGCNLLQHAVVHGQLDVVRMVLHAGIFDLEFRTPNRSTALHLGAWHGHVAVVQLLLEQGAQVDARMDHGDTALHQALASGLTC